MSDTLVAKLSQLLDETRRAHHQAFIATDGFDPDWPRWYAAYLQDKLGPLLNVDLSKSEIAELLILAEKAQETTDPEADWTYFYARFFLSRNQ